MVSFDLWRPDSVLLTVSGIEPRLACWESKSHPQQIRLQSYLEELGSRLLPLPAMRGPLFLQLMVDVEAPERLLKHYDIENYLTPLFGQRLFDPDRFVLVQGRKRVGGGSHLKIGTVQPLDGHLERDRWESFACSAGRGQKWKERLYDQFAASRPSPLPSGQVELHLSWRCAPVRNWVNLWKATGDAMSPVLGLENPRARFSPQDGRVTRLDLHLTDDPAMGYDVDVGMWWRLAS